MSAEQRRTLVIGHLLLGALAAAVGAVVIVNFQGGVAPYLVLLAAIWISVRELANAADLEFDLAWQWTYDDGAPRPPTWTDPAAASAGAHLLDLVDRLEHPIVHESIAVGSGIEVVEILDEADRP